MLKKRLIFTLLMDGGHCMLSRNFSLQRGGDLAWLRKHYEFNAIAFSIDELLVINVSRTGEPVASFAAALRDIAKCCYMPIAAGGGIRSLADAQTLLAAGADKLIINAALFEDPALVQSLVQHYGSQCVIASIDYRRDGGKDAVYTRQGTVAAGCIVSEAVSRAVSLGVGEIYLTSIDKDGTGQGCDLQFAAAVASSTTVPLIVSGGAGTFDHLARALRSDHLAAVSTANLFNFMGDNLTEARSHIIASGTPLATWDALPTPLVAQETLI